MSTTLPQDPLALLTRTIRAHRVELVQVARREGLGPEDAVDCLQDALITFLDVVHRGEVSLDEAAVRPYLAGIVRNAARNKRRLHHLARPHASIDSIEPGSGEPFADAIIARAETHVRLRACVSLLCGTQRAVVTLRLLEERRGEDVAASLGITRGHVDVLLHRAKAQLRACMADDHAA